MPAIRNEATMSCTAQGPPVPSGLEPTARANQRGPRRWPAGRWAHPFDSKIQVSALGSYPHIVLMSLRLKLRITTCILMKPMKTREVLAALTQAGCTELRRRGRHRVYLCPCGLHRVPLPGSHGEVSAGVLTSLVRQLPCLPEGWLR